MLSKILGVTAALNLALMPTICFAQTQKYQEADPICYYQLPNGSKVSLENLCKGNSSQPVNLTQTSQELILQNVKHIRRFTRGESRSFIYGEIVNNSGEERTLPKIQFLSYRKSSGSYSVDPNDSGVVRTKSAYLTPGQVTSFEIELERLPQLFVVNIIATSEKLYNKNICFADGVEKLKDCEQISPSSIRRF